MENVHFQPGSWEDVEDPSDQIYVALLVPGEEGELLDATGLAWGLPDAIHDTPRRSQIWADHCVEIMKWVIVHSKPRQAIKDATGTMETVFLMSGEPELFSMDALRGRG